MPINHVLAYSANTELMLRRDKILSEIYKEKVYQTICRNLVKDEIKWEDLYSVFLLSVCELKPETLFNAYDQEYIENFCVKIIFQQFFSDRSTYYIQHRKFQLNRIEEDVSEYMADKDVGPTKEELLKEEKKRKNTLKKIENIVSKQHWYDAQLFTLYYSGDYSSFRDMEKDIGINYNSIRNSVNNIKDKVINKLNKK